MNASFTHSGRIALGFTTAMAAVLLSACTTGSAPRADVSASAATRDMERGRHERAVQHAEAAAFAEPHNAGYRMLLGNAYLDAGRFASAEAAFSDAMTLGDTSPRAALALALARIAQADYPGALDVLHAHEGEIARADLGLALALAGQPERGIHVMSNAIRGGENTVKMRQNLAYAYAMAGRWREARLMTAQDVPAGEVGARLEQWARLAPAEAYQQRIAGLLGVPVGVADAGQPMHLALANSPSVEQLAAEAEREPALFADRGELPATTLAPPARDIAAPVAPVAAAAAPVAAGPALSPAPAPRDFAAAFAPPAPTPTLETRRMVSIPVVQPIPARAEVAHAGPTSRSAASAPARTAADGTHLVQLGSFLSEAGARRAWHIYTARYPELASREMVLTEAMVRGRHYWRVSAGGFDQNDSRAMCNRVSERGASCITWAANRPLPGAVDNGIRLARR